MKTAIRSSTWIALVSLAAIAGCGKKKVETVTIPDSPDGTVQTVAKALSENKPQALWSALPASYQKQIKELTTEFANTMDKDVWDKSFAVFGKAVRIAKEKQDFILNSPAFADGQSAAKKEEAKKAWPALTDLLDSVANSEIKTLEGIKNLDIEAFLGTTVSKVMQNGSQFAALSPMPQANPFEKVDKLKQMKVTVVKSEGDAATLKIEVPDQPTKEEKFVKVEGKWIPEDIANNFQSSMGQAKAMIGQIKLEPATKTQVMAMLGGLDSGLDQVLAAKTQEEFNQASEGLTKMIPLPGIGGPGFGGPKLGPRFDDPGFDGPGIKDPGPGFKLPKE